MAIGCENLDVDFCLEYTIDHAMFFCYFAAPSVLRLAFQRLRVSGAGLGMLSQFFEEAASLGKGLRLILGEAL